MDPSDPVDVSIFLNPSASQGKGSLQKTAKVFALDISGSMGAAATDGNECTGKTIVELISEISASVVHSMTDNQLAGAVVFNQTASTLFPISDMSDTNRLKMSTALKGMQAGGATNLWGAIELSVRLLQATCKKDGESYPCAIDLLTDGIPNVDPPNLRGYEASLDDLCVMLDGFMPTINIFGFGNAIDVPLLEAIAIKTGGHFSYISDPGMAATAFVNSAATWGAQDKPVVLDETTELRRREMVSTFRDMRRFCKLSNFAGAQEFNRKLIESIESSISASAAGSPSTYVLAEFVKDLYSEVALAVSDSAVFKKWGNNYLTSLARAHELKICANFKDKGLQVYQTQPNFSVIQERVASIFTTAMARLAAEGEARAAALGSSAAAAAAANQSRSLSNMYNPHGGCVDGRCIVSMADGTFKYLENVQIGDKIFGGANGRTVVEVYEKVTTKPKHGTDLAYFSNTSFVAGHLKSQFVLTTSWHPVLFRSKSTNEWQFPCKSSFPKILAPSGAIIDHGFENVISIAVRAVHFGFDNDASSAHGFLVNNSIICATLAHGVKGDDVLEHSFWGSTLVLDAIREMKRRASARGILNPVVGTAPFHWEFSPHPHNQCVGICEVEPIVPLAPSRPFSAFNNNCRSSSSSSSYKIETNDNEMEFLCSESAASGNNSSAFLVEDIV